MAFLSSRMNKSYHRTFYVGGNTVSNLIPTPENCPLGTNNIELSLLGQIGQSACISFTKFIHIN